MIIICFHYYKATLELLSPNKPGFEILKKSNNQRIFAFLSKFVASKFSGWKKRRNFIRN